MASLPPHMKPNAEQGTPYYVFTAYGQSKTANILHAQSISKRMEVDGARAFAVHPGCELWSYCSA